jgi:hypothetical protein
MGADALSNLARIGQLKVQAPDRAEFQRMLMPDTTR